MYIYMYIKYDKKHYIISFLMYSFYYSILIGIIFMVNDYLSSYYKLEQGTINFNTVLLEKTISHVIITFFITFILVLTFWHTFGWGSGFVSKK